MLTIQRLRQSLIHCCFKPIRQTELAPRLEAYLVGPAAKVLGFSHNEPGRLEPIETGRNTVVRRWIAPDGDILFARAWRYDRMQRPALEHVEAGRALASAGLCVPELLLLDDSLALMRKGRFEMTVERAAEGRPLIEWVRGEPANPPIEALKRLAVETAWMHRIESPVWGKPWRPYNPMSHYREFILDRIETLRARILKAETRFEPVQINRAFDMLAGAIRRLPLDRALLVHGDLFGAHVFVDGQGRLTWIDFGTVHYGHPAEDLCIIRNWLPEALPFAEFMECYQAAGGFSEPGLDETIEHFNMFRLWEKLGSRLGKLRRADNYSDEKKEALLKEQAFIERTLARRM